MEKKRRRLNNININPEIYSDGRQKIIDLPDGCFGKVAKFLDPKSRINFISTSKKTFYAYNEKEGVQNKNLKPFIRKQIEEDKIIVPIQKEIYTSFNKGEGCLYANEKLRRFINSIKKEDINKAFNTLPKEFKQGINEVNWGVLHEGDFEQLEHLPALEGFIKVEHFYCYGNKIKSININGLTGLKNFECQNNEIEILNIDFKKLENLESLCCSKNYLTKKETEILLNSCPKNANKFLWKMQVSMQKVKSKNKKNTKQSTQHFL